MKRLIYILIALAAFTSCSEIEWKVYDNPYVYLILSGDTALSESSTVLSLANTERQYNVCLSSKKQSEAIEVYFDVLVGDGLEEGLDFEILNEGRAVVFEPGEYVQPIKIKYMKHKVDKTKDNTLTLRLTGASIDIGLGVPSAEPRNVSHTIKKKN